MLVGKSNLNISEKDFNSLKAGDSATFKRVYGAYYARIRAFIYSITKSESDADDLISNVFLKLWENHENLQSRSTLNSYLFTVAKHEAFDYLRKKRSEDRYVSYQKHIPTDGYGVEEEMLSRELLLLIRSELSQLPPRKRTIFEKSRKDGLDNAEIAAKLHISEKTVANNISEVLAVIRKLIK